MTDLGSAVLTYRRCSTQEQADSGLGMAGQASGVAAYLARLGLAPTGAHVDEGVSAAVPLDGRPGGSALLADLARACASGRRGRRHAPYAHLVVYRLDRCFRSALETLQWVDRWQREGVVFHEAHSGLQWGALDDPLARATSMMLLSLLASVAEMERAQIQARTKGALAQLRKSGKPAGYPRFGEQLRCPDRSCNGAPGASGHCEACGAACLLVPHEEELVTAGLIARWYGERPSATHVAQRLARGSRPTKRGATAWSAWSVQRVLKWLDAPVYGVDARAALDRWEERHGPFPADGIPSVPLACAAPPLRLGIDLPPEGLVVEPPETDRTWLASVYVRLLAVSSDLQGAGAGLDLGPELRARLELCAWWRDPAQEPGPLAAARELKLRHVGPARPGLVVWGEAAPRGQLPFYSTSGYLLWRALRRRGWDELDVAVLNAEDPGDAGLREAADHFAYSGAWHLVCGSKAEIALRGLVPPARALYVRHPAHAAKFERAAGVHGFLRQLVDAGLPPGPWHPGEVPARAGSVVLPDAYRWLPLDFYRW